jgi:hypothetical protein
MKDKVNSRFDEGRQLDDLFRQGLENLRPEPSKDLWKGINRRLWWDEISHFTFTNLSKVLLIGGIASMMTLITALMVVVVPQAKSSDENTFSILNDQGSDNSSLMIPVFSLSNQTYAPFINKSSERQIEKEIPAETILRTNIPPSTDPDEGLLADRFPTSVPNYYSNTSDSYSGKKEQEKDPGVLSFMESINNENILLINPDNSHPWATPSSIQNNLKGNPPMIRFFAIDMGVSPEVSFNNNSSGKSEINFSCDLGLIYHFGRFSVRTGIGIGYIADEGNYRIDYKSKDSVGFYNKVVSFTVNQQNPSEVNFVTQQMVVYDSLQHIADDRTRNRYTYLHVPFFIGFRILETNRLALTIHAGPMISFLVGKKEAQPVIEYPNARIIRIDNNTPVRANTSWQLWLGLRLDYKINKEFSLFAEPNYKYYFKPVVEQNEDIAKNPYSIGLGIGIQYNFGRKIQKP